MKKVSKRAMIAALVPHLIELISLMQRCLDLEMQGQKLTARRSGYYVRQGQRQWRSKRYAEARYSFGWSGQWRKVSNRELQEIEALERQLDERRSQLSTLRHEGTIPSAMAEEMPNALEQQCAKLRTLFSFLSRELISAQREDKEDAMFERAN